MNWKYYKVVEVLWKLSIILASWNVYEQGSIVNRGLFDWAGMVEECVDEMGEEVVTKYVSSGSCSVFTMCGSMHGKLGIYGAQSVAERATNFIFRRIGKVKRLGKKKLLSARHNYSKKVTVCYGFRIRLPHSQKGRNGECNTAYLLTNKKPHVVMW